MKKSKIKYVIQLLSDIYRPACVYCEDLIRHDGNDLELAINHYLVKHNCELLHVGSYTTRDDMENPWHGLTAILGSEIIPIQKDWDEMIEGTKWEGIL